MCNNPTQLNTGGPIGGQASSVLSGLGIDENNTPGPTSPGASQWGKALGMGALKGGLAGTASAAQRMNQPRGGNGMPQPPMGGGSGMNDPASVGALPSLAASIMANYLKNVGGGMQ